MSEKIIVSILIIAISIVVVVVFWVTKSAKDEMLKLATRVQEISMQMISDYFKKEEILAKLRENKNLVASVMKEKVVTKDEINFHITACLFDKSNSQVVNIENSLNLISTKMDDNLASAFGNKDMIALA